MKAIAPMTMKRTMATTGRFISPYPSKPIMAMERKNAVAIMPNTILILRSCVSDCYFSFTA